MSRGGSGPGRASSAAQLLGRGVRRGGCLLLVRPGQRVMHEHHVRVAAVAGLVAAEPAHRHHAQPGGELTPAVRHGPYRHLERGLDGDRGHGGERFPGLLGARPAEQVGHGGPEQFPAAQCAQRRHRGGGVAVPANQRRGLRVQRRAVAGGKLSVVAEPGDGLRLAQQQARAYRLEASSVAIRCATVMSSRSSRRYHGLLPEGVADLVERQQPGIGVRRVGEPAEQQRQQRALDGRPPRHPGGQRPDVPQRAGRIGVTERLEPGLGRLRGEPGRLAGQAGHRVEQRPVEQLLVQPLDLARMLTPPGEQLLGRVQAPGGAARGARAAVTGLGLPGGPRSLAAAPDCTAWPLPRAAAAPGRSGAAPQVPRAWCGSAAGA